MRILHIETLNQVGHTYAGGLERRGHVVTFFEPSLAGGAAPLPIRLAHMPGRLLHLRQVVGRLNRGHCDIVHIHWASYGVLGLVSQVPFVVHCHGSDVRGRLNTRFFRTALSPALRRAGAVLCITPDLVPIVREQRSDAIYFPGAVDTGLFAPQAAHAPHPWTILLLSRLEPVKGVDIAVQGIERFAARHPDARVVLIDEGTLSAVYRARCGARFEFVPWRPLAEVPQLIAQADVVVGQFLIGTLGLAELQAMSCAKPVIASLRQPDAYPAPPPLCPADTADAVDAHLERLFDHPEEASALGGRAREWVRAHHGQDALAARLEALYQQVIARHAEQR
jgi:glycosyltransferase involved in cell wall biosynthesis